MPLVLYESPHRFQKTLAALEKAFGSSQRIVVGRELTKFHEEIWRGTLKEAPTYFTGDHARGEFVIIIP